MNDMNCSFETFVINISKLELAKKKTNSIIFESIRYSDSPPLM